MMYATGFARLLAPADDRQIKFGDEPVRERHARQTSQSQSAFRFTHFDTCAFGQCEEKRKLMDERVREEVQKMLRENGAEHADRESGSEKQVNDEEISDKTQK